MSDYAKDLKVVDFMRWPLSKRLEFINKEMAKAPAFLKEALLSN